MTTLVAKDLTTEYPRSPKETIAGYVIAARALDKCRATLAGTAGEYHFNCPLDQMFFEFSGVDSNAFKDFVETGAEDSAVAEWIKENASEKTREEVVAWNFKMRDSRMSEMPSQVQVYMEDEYWPNYLPGNYPHFFFDIYDMEEGRM
ncbi:MAG: DUF5069 domain-containing protein [Verrucomicrobiota bacterium]